MADVNPIEVQGSLGGMNYPASKQDLIEHAQKQGGKNNKVVEVLNQIPDKEYNSPVDVTKEVGKIV